MAKRIRNKKVNVGRFLPLREIDITASTNDRRVNVQLVLLNTADVLHATKVLTETIQTLQKRQS